MSTTTFGLGYLDEQQRFRRSPSPSTSKPQPAIADIKTAGQTGRPLVRRAHTIDDIRSRSDKAVQMTAIEPTIPQAQAEAVPTVFSDQFTEQVEIKRSKVRTFLPVAVAALALLSGLAVLGLSLRQNHQAVAQVAAITEKSKSDVPSTESPPSEEPVSAKVAGTYSVASDLPKLITIKKINVYARVLQMGILSSGALATPRNTNDTGWYNGSSKPGDGGTALIVGHVSGAVKAGIFYNLKKLETGDIITVERGDGVKIDYRVVKKEQVPAADVNVSKLLLPVTTGKAGLNLMTCGGQYQPDKETFTDRVIVYTEKV